MRTKTLLIAAAALAAGILASSAQTYSQNIVGYVTQVLPVGYSLITVPLTATNTGNTVPANQALTCIQPNDAVIVWNGLGYSTYTYYNAGVGFTWEYPDGTYGDVAPNLTLGQAFFYSNGSTPETNIFTGTVVLTNSIALPVGYSLVGSTPPVGGAVTNTASFNFPLQPNDAMIVWNGLGYSTYTYYNAGVGFTWEYPDGTYGDTPPNLIVGQGFFYSNGSTPETWNQNVVVP